MAGMDTKRIDVVEGIDEAKVFKLGKLASNRLVRRLYI